jgi:hypothetical protein
MECSPHRPGHADQPYSVFYGYQMQLLLVADGECDDARLELR